MHSPNNIHLMLVLLAAWMAFDSVESLRLVVLESCRVAPPHKRINQSPIDRLPDRAGLLLDGPRSIRHALMPPRSGRGGIVAARPFQIHLRQHQSR
jgi:hypothetical protein